MIIHDHEWPLLKGASATSWRKRCRSCRRGAMPRPVRCGSSLRASSRRALRPRGLPQNRHAATHPPHAKHNPGPQDAQAQTVEKEETATTVRSQHWVPARRMRCVYRQSPALEGKSAAASVVPHGHRPPSPHTHARRRSLSRRRCSSLSSSGKASRSTCRSDPAEISPRSRRDLAAISPRYQAPKPDDPREVSPLYLCCISTVSPLYLRRCRNR